MMPWLVVRVERLYAAAIEEFFWSSVSLGVLQSSVGFAVVSIPAALIGMALTCISRIRLACSRGAALPLSWMAGGVGVGIFGVAVTAAHWRSGVPLMMVTSVPLFIAAIAAVIRSGSPSPLDLIKLSFIEQMSRHHFSSGVAAEIAEEVAGHALRWWKTHPETTEPFFDTATGQVRDDEPGVFLKMWKEAWEEYWPPGRARPALEHRSGEPPTRERISIQVIIAKSFPQRGIRSTTAPGTDLVGSVRNPYPGHPGPPEEPGV